MIGSGGTGAVCVRGLVVVVAGIDFAFFALPFKPVDFVTIVVNLRYEIGVETAVAVVRRAGFGGRELVWVGQAVNECAGALDGSRSATDVR